MTEPRPSALGNRAVLRLPEFRKLFVAQAISDAGDAMTFMALLFVVNALTHSTAVLAGLSIAIAVPAMVGGVVAGAVADRFDRRRIMLASDSVRALLVLGFIFVGTVERLPILFVIAFAQASIGTLFTPARGALIPRVVPGEGLMAANGLSQMGRTIASVVGVATTGVLFALTGEAWPVFLVDAATFVISVAIVLRVDPALGAPSPEAHATQGGFGASVTDGLRAIAASPTLTATVAGLSIAMLGLGAVNVLFVPFLVNTLGESAAWTGPIEGAQTIAMVLASGLMATLAARATPQRLFVGAMFGVGVLIVLLSAAPNVLALLALLFASGWLVMPLHASTMTLIQTLAADKMRGRILGALNAAQSTTTIVSMAAAGIFASVVGVRTVLFAGGLICLVAVVVTAILFSLDRREAARIGSVVAEG
jgi:MFS family permease